MKRLLRYATIAFAILSLSACECDEGTTPRPDRLGKTIWDIAYPDLQRVNEIFNLVANYNYYLTIEDDFEVEDETGNSSNSESDRFKREKLNNPKEITVVDNVHTLIYETGYGTTYSITFVMQQDKWEVTRTGGNGFDLTIRETGKDTYDAVFNSIYNSESTGYGEFTAKMFYNEEGTPDIEFKGTLVMVDREESYTNPLTVTTKITEWLRFSNEQYYDIVPTKGKMVITVTDELYNTTDKITAYIVKNDYHYGVSIECLGDKQGYYF